MSCCECKYIRGEPDYYGEWDCWCVNEPDTEWGYWLNDGYGDANDDESTFCPNFEYVDGEEKEEEWTLLKQKPSL